MSIRTTTAEEPLNHLEMSEPETRENLLNPDFMEGAKIYQNKYAIDVPDSLFGAFEALQDENAFGMIVGGAVRDVVLKKEGVAEIEASKDFDVEVYGMSQEHLERFLNSHFGSFKQKVGGGDEAKPYPVYEVSVEGINEPVEFALSRTEVSTGEGKGDFEFVPDPTLTYKQAAQRRDLNVNSMAYNPLTGAVYDAYEGVESIKSNEISFVEEEKFKEDPSRVLRAIKYASRYDMELSAECVEVCREMVSSGALEELSVRLRTQEFLNTLTESPRPSKGIKLYDSIGVVEKYWPELNALKGVSQDPSPDRHPEGDVWIHNNQVLDAAAEIADREGLTKDERLLLIVASLGHDFGKPSTTKFEDGRWRAKGHEEAGVEPMRQFMSRFDRFTPKGRDNKQFQTAVLALVEDHIKVAALFEDEKKLAEEGQGHNVDKGFTALSKRLEEKGTNLKMLTLLTEADKRGRNPDSDTPKPLTEMPQLVELKSWVESKESQLSQAEASASAEKARRESLLSSKDLIKAVGEKPGPWVGAVLKSVYANESIATPEEALTQALELQQKLAAYVADRETKGADSWEVWKEIQSLENPQEIFSSRKDASEAENTEKELREYMEHILKGNEVFARSSYWDPEDPLADSQYKAIYPSFRENLRYLSDKSVEQNKAGVFIESLANVYAENPENIQWDYERSFAYIESAFSTGDPAAYELALKVLDQFQTDFHMHESDDPIQFEYHDEPNFRLHQKMCRYLVENYENSAPDKRKEVTDFLTKAIGINSEGSVFAYVEAFESLGSELAISALLENLQSPDFKVRGMSESVLLKLELGRLGVSKEGLEHLGKIYNLGKYNDDKFFVRRLDSRGRMAVLSGESNSIEGMFDLDLNSNQKHVSAEVRSMVSQDIFLPRADESTEERAEKDRHLERFVEEYESLLDNEILAGTGVRLNSLDLHEQGWFVLYYLDLLKSGDEVKAKELHDFVQDYGESGIKAFLALDYGGTGDEILDFAREEAISIEEKKTIMRQYSAIATQAYKIRSVFDSLEDGSSFAPQVHEAFLRKNSEFFIAAQKIARGEGADVTLQELTSQMKSISFALSSLEGLTRDDSKLELVSTPNRQVQYDESGNPLEHALTTHELVDSTRNSRVVVSIRPEASSAGEARINFSVANQSTGEKVRIGFDVSDYNEDVATPTPPKVSLDLGIGEIEQTENGRIFPSDRVGRVLQLAEGSEGGHNELSFSPEAVSQFPIIAVRLQNHLDSRFEV